MMTLYEYNIRMKMKTVGAVVFIRLLLLIAGVESNPGPDDVLVFRYQYLLVEVGTKLLKKLFDDVVNNDFMQYLRTHPDIEKKLENYYPHQKELLAPKDNKPDSGKFDISLLARLLTDMFSCHKNIPGIDVIKDLRECRYDLQHKSTVRISQAEYDQKWDTLCKLLHRLNLKGIKVKYLIPDLTEMIEDARKKPLDDQLKKENEEILRRWHEEDLLFEKGIAVLKIGQSGIKEDLGKSKEVQTELKDDQSEIREGLSEIKADQSELKDGFSDIKEVLSEIKVDQLYILQSLNNFENKIQNIKACLAQEERKKDIVEQSDSSNILRKGFSNDGRLVFRYLYLLVEVGTKLLRRLFDDIVGNDFMQYLQTYPHCRKQLEFLMKRSLRVYENVLPPTDNTPCSANFDITLLTVLLSTICGLKTRVYLVEGDMSVEADITRLRHCRNELMHRTTLRMPSEEFNQKWDALIGLLHRLNLRGKNLECLFPDLTEMIEDVRNIPLDDQ